MQLLSKDNVPNIEKYCEDFLLEPKQKPALDVSRDDTSVQTREYLSNHKFIRKLLRIFIFIKNYITYAILGREVQIDSSTILFSANDGKGYTGNPKAVYERMINDSRFKSYRFVWLFNEPEKYYFLLNNPNTFIVENSPKSFGEITHEAKYWMFDFRIPSHVFPRPEQIYVQLGHGNPVKKSGYSVNFSVNPRNSVTEYKLRYFLDAKKIDILVTPSNFASRRFKAEYNLEKLGKEEIIKELGNPKSDFLAMSKKSNVDVNAIKDMLGIKDKNKKVILYAPAFRDDQYDALSGFTFKNHLDFDYLTDELERDYVIIYRPHYDMTVDFNFDMYNGFVYDGTAIDDINYLYLVSDVLITDYSTAMFEYAFLGKPIIHFIYDYKTYSKTVRPLYFNDQELPGVVAKTLDDVVAALKVLYLLPNNDSVVKTYEEFNKKYNYKCDGLSSKRVADVIINEIWD